MGFGKEFLDSIYKPSQYTLKTPANRIPGEYLRALAEKYIDPNFVKSYVDYGNFNELKDVPEALLRDALLGSQKGAGWNTNRGDLFQSNLINRLNHYKPLAPYQEFTKTGEDYYRLMHPDEVVVPYRRSYNDEQLIDLVVPEKKEMADIWNK